MAVERYQDPWNGTLVSSHLAARAAAFCIKCARLVRSVTEACAAGPQSEPAEKTVTVIPSRKPLVKIVKIAIVLLSVKSSARTVWASSGKSTAHAVPPTPPLPPSGVAVAPRCA